MYKSFRFFVKAKNRKAGYIGMSVFLTFNFSATTRPSIILAFLLSYFGCQLNVTIFRVWYFSCNMNRPNADKNKESFD